MNYARETFSSTKGRVVLNSTHNSKKNKRDYVILDEKRQESIAHFNCYYLNDFYEVLQDDIEMLREQGAEVIVVYPHWGKEYCIDARDSERKIAQKICDYGVDIIVGDIRMLLSR